MINFIYFPSHIIPVIFCMKTKNNWNDFFLLFLILSGCFLVVDEICQY